MAEGTTIPLNKIKQLTGKNYHVWTLKVKAVLKVLKLCREVIEAEAPPESDNPEFAEGKRRFHWENKNDEAFGIVTILSDKQAG